MNYGDTVPHHADTHARAVATSAAEHKLQHAVDVCWALLVLTTVICCYVLVPADAFAGSKITGVICSVVNIFRGDLGRSLGTIAISILGIGALLGKISWPLALTTFLGIAVMFGASGIVRLLYGQTGCTGGGATGSFGPLTRPFCQLAIMLSSGSTAKVIATVGVQLLAMAAFFGKITWNSAIIVAIGVALMFGASAYIASEYGANLSCAFFIPPP